MKGNLEVPAKTQEKVADRIELPAPTAWPIVLALGITLMFAGMLTTMSVSILGAILAASASIGWFYDVLPYERSEVVRVSEEPIPVTTTHHEVERFGWITREPHRARVPIEIYPVSAGIKGGLAGSVVMAVLAIIYGLAAHHSIWYPINLLAAGFLPPAENTLARLVTFQFDLLIIATVIHLLTSVLVGLLYGAMLPMVPRRPIVLGGLVGPILWSGLIHGVVTFLNPVLSRRINWPWFVISQIGFGIVAGIVVSRQQHIRTWQHLPLPMRAGIETSGAMGERDLEDFRR
jgi:hypothetical protein